MPNTDHELLCHVDEADRVVGSCRRGDAHRYGLRHRAVHILVFNGAGKVFLQKRARNKDINPGLWDTSAAGHVDYGETYDQCAARELAEELGIGSVAALEPLFKLPASERSGWEFVQVYRIRYDGDPRLNAAEIDEGRWFTPDEIDSNLADDRLPLTSSFVTLWQTFRGLSLSNF